MISTREKAINCKPVLAIEKDGRGRSLVHEYLLSTGGTITLKTLGKATCKSDEVADRRVVVGADGADHVHLLLQTDDKWFPLATESSVQSLDHWLVIREQLWDAVRLAVDHSLVDHGGRKPGRPRKVAQ